MIKFKSDRLTIFESSLYRTNSLIISNESQLMVIDPNWLPSEIREIQCCFHNTKQHKITYTLFTHADFDHIIGWKAFDTDITIAPARMQDSEREKSVLEEIERFDSGYYIKRDYPILYPKADISVNKKISLEFGEEKIYINPCEGHSHDDMMLFVEDRGLWVAGDYLSNIELPMIDYDISKYHQALILFDEFIKQEKPRMLIPGHGDVTGDIQEMKRRLDQALMYLDALMSANEDQVEKIISNLPFRHEQYKIHQQNKLNMSRNTR